MRQRRAAPAAHARANDGSFASVEAGRRAAVEHDAPADPVVPREDDLRRSDPDRKRSGELALQRAGDERAGWHDAFNRAHDTVNPLNRRDGRRRGHRPPRLDHVPERAALLELGEDAALAGSHLPLETPVRLGELGTQTGEQRREGRGCELDRDLDFLTRSPENRGIARMAVPRRRRARSAPSRSCLASRMRACRPRPTRRILAVIATVVVRSPRSAF